MKRMIEEMDFVVIIVGFHRGAPSPRDPWNVAIRKKWIAQSVLPDFKKFTIQSVGCTLYDDEAWVQTVTNEAERFRTSDEDEFFLYGHHKDKTSDYLGWFPRWETRDLAHDLPTISSTQIRAQLFENGSRHGIDRRTAEWEYLPHVVREDLERGRDENSIVVEWLQNDWDHIKAYKKSWEAAPYPPVLVTADSVVFLRGHVLLVQRGGPYRKGTFALPGGHFEVEKDRDLENTAIRETLEETGINLENAKLIDQHRFAHPLRSHLGRVVTTAFCFDFHNWHALKPTAGDDADDAFWAPISELHRKFQDNFFEDHLDIIEHFLHKGRNAKRL